MNKCKYRSGDRFNRWTLIEYVGNGKWRARCDCGHEQDCYVSHLTSGNSTGCMDCAAKSKITIGYYYPYEYSSWNHMRQRCNNANNSRYEQYGGRGITICKEWDSFEAFLSDMGPRPAGTSLDRIDVNLNYSKDNCRWATAKEQARNRRKLCVVALAEQAGMSQGAVQTRLYRGWDIEKALSVPLHVKSESICAKARERGLPESTVLSRVNRGWTLEKALSTPVQKRQLHVAS